MPKIPPQVGEKVRELANDPNVRQYAAMAAIGGGLSTAAGARMDNTIERDKSKGVKQSDKWVNRAAKKEGKKYKPVGNNVYAKERKFFPAQSHEYVQQTVKDNKGSKNKIYLKTHYPNGVLGGLTMAKPKDNKARIEGYPHLLSTKQNKVKDRYVASHEKRHVDQMAGTNQLPDMIDRAGEKAKKEVPKKHNLVVDAVSLKAYKRNEAYKKALKNESAQREGGADKYASEKHKTPSWKVTAYPQMANKKDRKPQLKNPLHTEPTPWAAGYKEGGGKGKPKYFSAERKADKEQWKKKVASVSKSAFGPEIEKKAAPEGLTTRQLGDRTKAKRKGQLIGGVAGTLLVPIPIAGTVGGAVAGGKIATKDWDERHPVKVKKSDGSGPFGVEISKRQCECDCADCKTSCNCDCAKCSKVSKAAKFALPGATKKGQVTAQLNRVAQTKGSKPTFKRLADAKAAAGAKFQNK